MRIARTPWFFALLYTALSLGVEAALIVFVGLTVPQDKAQIALVILTISPYFGGGDHGL